MSNRIYAVRDMNTGKLVSNITNPGRKFWERKGNAEAAIRTFNSRRAKPKHGELKLVTYELVEVVEDND